jgi:hypothetical protein
MNGGVGIIVLAVFAVLAFAVLIFANKLTHKR